MADDPRAVAFSPSAPETERTDALRDLTRAHLPTGADIIPPGTIAELQAGLDMLKAARVIPFPSERARAPAASGRQSVALDEMQVAMAGDYYDPPAALSPEIARRMVDQTPILSAIVMTRQRQVSRFCNLSEDDGMGFAIRHVDAKHQLAPEEEASIRRLTGFFRHCGWEWSPRKRKALGRDSFHTFMMKLTRDTLTLDRAPIEVEAKRDRSLGIDGLYAIDGGSFRLCPPGQGYRGDRSIYALQVINGRIATAYDAESVIFEARNPRADVRFGDYGFSELDVLVQTVTGFLNAMTLNIAGFQRNSIPKGILTLIGEYGDAELASFKQYWQAMLRGAENAWAAPVMVSKDPQGKAQFEKTGIEFNEMYFGKWMTFLTSVICAVFSMDPSEINFESFTNGASSLSGDDTSEKLAASKDKGLRPLLSYFENLFSDYVCADIGEKYCFRWLGLDPKDEAREWEARKLSLTVDELRARLGEEKHENETIGGAPLNPSLIGLYQQSVMPQGSDFGAAGDFGSPDGGSGAGPGGEEDRDRDGMPADTGDQPGPGEDGAPPDRLAAKPPGQAQAGGPDFGKALPTIFSIGG